MRTATVTFVIAAMFSITAVAQDLTSWYQVQGGEWQVPVNIASEAASRIQAAADKAAARRIQYRLVGDYSVQYQGVSVNGKRLVRLMGACSSQAGPAEGLTSTWRIIFDGGLCYYNAEYDPDLKLFVSFEFNGYG